MKRFILLALMLSGCGEAAVGPATPTLIAEVDLTTTENQYGARYPSVIRDPKTGIFRAYYLVERTSPVKELHYAESIDGVSFTPKGLAFHFNERLYGAEVSYDTSKGRYVLAFHSNPGNEIQSIDYSAWKSRFAFSDDGLNWTVDESSEFRPASTVSDAPTLPRFNEESGLYQMMIRPRIGYRAVSLIQSPDLKEWSEPTELFSKHIEGEKQIQYYGMPTFQINGKWIGLLLRMETPLEKMDSPTGRYQTYLAKSEDGLKWEANELTPVLPTLNKSEDWQASEAFEINGVENVYGSGGMEATSIVAMPDGSYNIYASGFLVDHSLLVKQRLAGKPATKLLVFNVSGSFFE